MSQQLQQSPYFDPQDFQGINKYKLLAPLLYITSWILMFTGPSLFPVQYQLYQILLLAYVTLKLLYAFFIAARGTYLGLAALRKNQQLEQGRQYSNLQDEGQELIHAFIIPSYNENVQLLSETLKVIASHNKAKNNYLVFLAMEAHQDNSQQKAFQLMEKFRQSYRVIGYTNHTLRRHESKGKASNVSWCVQHLNSIFQKYLINPDNVMLTVIDSDSWVPQLYIDELERAIYQQFDEKDRRIYQPIQIFTRNSEDVPFITRIIDSFHSFAYFSTHFSFSGITFSLSNYSLSYSLAKEINFWDTCADAIGEDFHTFSKAFWKTDGQVKGYPIIVPLNQMSLSTGEGYWQDIKARFWQVQRHARGITQLAYAFKMFFSNPFKLKNLYFLLIVFDIFAFMVLVPWVAVSFNFHKLLNHYYKASPELYTEQFLGYFITAFSIIGTIAFLLFYIFKRKANSILYKNQNQSLLRLLEYLLLFTITFAIFIIPSFVIASFRVLFGRNQYNVAQKHIKKESS